MLKRMRWSRASGEPARQLMVHTFRGRGGGGGVLWVFSNASLRFVRQRIAGMLAVVAVVVIAVYIGVQYSSGPA